MSKLNVTAQPGTQNIVMTREFNAPRALVFKAHTDAALVPQWWGPASTTTEVSRLDATPGGKWHYVHRSGDDVYNFHGFYHEVVVPARLVSTYEFDGMPGQVGLVTLTLDEHEGKTIVTETSVFPSVEIRDAVIQSGMESGAAESYDRMEALLKSIETAR